LTSRFVDVDSEQPSLSRITTGLGGIHASSRLDAWPTMTASRTAASTAKALLAIVPSNQYLAVCATNPFDVRK